jgi:hypothetical protein
MGPLQPQNVRRLLDRRMDVLMAGDRHLLGRLLSVSGGKHPTMWLTEVDGELSDVVLALDAVLDCQLIGEPGPTMRFARAPIPSTLDSINSPG